MSDQRIPTLVQLDRERIAQLDRIAAELSVSRSAAIRFAVDAYVKAFFMADVATNSQSSTPEADQSTAA